MKVLSIIIAFGFILGGCSNPNIKRASPDEIRVISKFAKVIVCTYEDAELSKLLPSSNYTLSIKRSVEKSLGVNNGFLIVNNESFLDGGVVEFVVKLSADPACNSVFIEAIWQGNTIYSVPIENAFINNPGGLGWPEFYIRNVKTLDPGIRDMRDYLLPR